MQEDDAAAQGILEAPFPMLTVAIWAKVYWPFLEVLALSVPATGDHSGKIALTLKHVLETLPCQLCAWHATAYLEQNPFDASSRLKAFSWVVALHNSINVRNGKKEFSVAEALSLRMQGWEKDAKKLLASGSDSSLNGWFVSGLVIAVIGVVAIGVAAFVLARSNSRSDLCAASYSSSSAP